MPDQVNHETAHLHLGSGHQGGEAAKGPSPRSVHLAKSPDAVVAVLGRVPRPDRLRAPARDSWSIWWTPDQMTVDPLIRYQLPLNRAPPVLASIRTTAHLSLLRRALWGRTPQIGLKARRVIAPLLLAASATSEVHPTPRYRYSLQLLASLGELLQTGRFRVTCWGIRIPFAFWREIGARFGTVRSEVQILLARLRQPAVRR